MAFICLFLRILPYALIAVASVLSWQLATILFPETGLLVRSLIWVPIAFVLSWLANLIAALAMSRILPAALGFVPYEGNE